MIQEKEIHETAPANTRNPLGAAKGARRRVRSLLVFAALSLALTACGGTGQGVQQGNALGAPAPEEPDSREGTANRTFTEGVASAPVSRGIILPDPGPSGIVRRPGSDDVYISNSEDGTVYRADVHDRRAEEFLPPGRDGRTVAGGLAADDSRLFIAGFETGLAFVYDAETGELLRRFESGSGGVSNDVAVTGDGDAYFTDLRRPVIWRIPAAEARNISSEPAELQPFLDLRGTAINYREGTNLDGIVATADGENLFTIQANTGRLYRIELGSRRVTEVDLSGERLENGEGMLLEEETLYVLRGDAPALWKLELSAEGDSGRVISETPLPPASNPTTLADGDDRLLIVNHQFDSTERPPYTVSRLPRP